MAAFFWIHAGANNNWATNGNWSATSGGGSNAAQPSVTSDVTFDGAGANGNDPSTVSAIQSVLSLTFTAGYTNTVTVNAVLTIAGNFTDNTAHSWAGSSAMTISAASTITSGGKTWPNNVTFSGANTKTLSGNWTITGTLTISAATVITSNTLSVGGLAVSGGTTGTCAISLTGGTWSGSSILQNNMTITGTVTISGTVAYQGGTLTCTSATVTTTSSLLNTNASTTFDTSAITWNNITIGGIATLTLNSLLSATGTFTLFANLAITFAGTTGFTVATLSCTHNAATTITLVNTVTYTITTAFNAFNSRTGAILLFTSDHASNKAILTLKQGATCNVLASFTRIDASLGRIINNFNGTVTTCNNINSFTDVNFIRRPVMVRSVGAY